MNIYHDLVAALKNAESNEHGWSAAKIEKNGIVYSASIDYRGTRFCVDKKQISKAKLKKLAA